LRLCFGAPGDFPPCILQRPLGIAGDWPNATAARSRLHSSSLDYLSRFKFARIKIAPNFSSSKSSRAIVKAAIGMAHELGLDVMVEGVETAEQLRRVRSWGCDQIQSFYFAKPMSAAEVTSLLLSAAFSLSHCCP